MAQAQDKFANMPPPSAPSKSAHVEIYTSPLCGFCIRAKALLYQNGVDYKEYVILTNPSHRAEMIERAKGQTSVPQIFINGEHIGGSDELYALDQTNELNRKLRSYV